jgi:hypothetical protein
MTSYDLPVSEAHWKALEARRKMLDARPKDSMPPLPIEAARGLANCQEFYETAAFFYFEAAQAYSSGDVVAGLQYQFKAHAYIELGHACEEAALQ